MLSGGLSGRYLLALLAQNFFLHGHRAAPRTLARARIRVRALAADREIAPVTNAAIALNFDKPADVHLDLLAEIAFDAPLLFNGLANAVDFLFGKVADLLEVVNIRLGAEILGAGLTDSVD